MNIQIFGKSKCFDTKKAERWFKERRIKFQSIDLVKFGMSGKEFDSVLRAVGGIDNLIDWDSKSQEVTNMKYIEDKITKEDKAKTVLSAENSPIPQDFWLSLTRRKSADLLTASMPRGHRAFFPCFGA